MAHDVARIVSTVEDGDTIIREVIAILRSRFNLYSGCVFMLQDDQLILRYGESDRQVVTDIDFDPIPLQSKASTVALAARLKETVSIEDVSRSSIYLEQDLFPRVKSEFAVPMVAGNKTIGTLILQTTEIISFNDEERQVLETITKQLGLALRNERLTQTAEKVQLKTQEIRALQQQDLSSRADELRQPLYDILAYSERMNTGTHGTLTPEQAQVIDQLLTQSEHLLAILNDLIGVRPIEINNQRFFIEDVNITRLLNEVIQQVRPVYSAGKMMLEADVANNLPVVWADERRLRQELARLLLALHRETEAGTVIVDATFITDGVLIAVDIVGDDLPEDAIHRTKSDDTTDLITYFQTLRVLLEAQGGSFALETVDANRYRLKMTILAGAVAQPGETGETTE